MIILKHNKTNTDPNVQQSEKFDTSCPQSVSVVTCPDTNACNCNPDLLINNNAIKNTSTCIHESLQEPISNINNRLYILEESLVKISTSVSNVLSAQEQDKKKHHKKIENSGYVYYSSRCQDI